MTISTLGVGAVIASHALATSLPASDPPSRPWTTVPTVMPSASMSSTRLCRLPDGHIVIAQETVRSSFAWEGRIALGPDDAGEPGGGGRLIEISTASGPVTIAWLPDGRCLQRIPIGSGRFRWHDGPADPGCRVVPPPSNDGGDDAAIARLGGDCDDGETLDVLVKWTPAARVQVGGDIAIRALAEASVAISNHVYSASGIRVRMRAVGYGETEAYDQDSTDQVLNHLRVIGDGYLDSVHAEREAVGADLVALIQGNSSFWCGVAYILGTPSPSFGFSCTVWSCALGNLTFTHEVGHNQGCCHAPGDGGGCTSGGIFP